jgi:hypothetical protein
MGADCKSVAKATKVRILHPPPGKQTAPDQLEAGPGPFAVRPAESSQDRVSTAVHGHIAGTPWAVFAPVELDVSLTPMAYAPAAVLGALPGYAEL